MMCAIPAAITGAFIGIPALIHALKPEHAVPKVVGHSVADAGLALKKAGLASENDSDGGPQSIVCRQDPAPGTKTRDTVSFTAGSACEPSEPQTTNSQSSSQQWTQNQEFEACEAAAGGLADYATASPEELQQIAQSLGIDSCPQ
jgi:beta-lactam-binding protein with PASTA domain